MLSLLLLNKHYLYIILKKILDNTFTKEPDNILAQYWGKFKFVPIIFYEVGKIIFCLQINFFRQAILFLWNLNKIIIIYCNASYEKYILIYRLYIFFVFVAYINTFQLYKNPQLNDNNIIHESMSRISLNKIINQYVLYFYTCTVSFYQCNRYILMCVISKVYYLQYYYTIFINKYLFAVLLYNIY